MAYSCGNTPNIGIDNDKHYCDPCLFDEQEKTSAAFCVICVEYLCQDCLIYHKKSKVSRHHTVLEDDSLPSNATPFRQLVMTLSCPSHRENRVEYECKDHDEYICVVCVSGSHRKCEYIEEIAKDLDENADQETGKLLQSKLLLLAEKTALLRKEKEQNIGYLREQKRNITEERRQIIKQIHDLLLKLDEKSENETEELLQKEINKTEEVLSQTLKKEREQKNHLELLETTLKYGDPKQTNIIVKRMSRVVEETQENNEEVGSQPKESVTFKTNISLTNLLEITSLGTVTINTTGEPQMKMEPDSHADIENSSCCDDNMASDSYASERNAPEYELKGDGSDDRCDKEVQVKLDLSKQDKGVQVDITTQEDKNKGGNDRVDATVTTSQTSARVPSLMEQNVVQAGKYKVSGSGDKRPCFISGLVMLPDQRIVLIDGSNEKIKVYDKNLRYLFGLLLDDRPYSVCQFGESSIAITYATLKKIDRFIIRDKQIYTDGGFPTKLYARGIARVGDHVGILFTDENAYTSISSFNDTVEIQVREISSGKIIKTIDTFQSWTSNTVDLIDPGSLLSRNKHEFMIVENDKLRCFDDNGELKWFYKCQSLKKVHDLTTDNEGNIYACGFNSGNVHQISASDYRKNRIIIPNIAYPRSILFDREKKRIIVGCGDDNYIYVYEFV